MQSIWLNSLPQDKILDATKLEVFADNKINVVQMMISVFDRVEKHCGKRSYQKASCFKAVESWDCVVKSSTFKG